MISYSQWPLFGCHVVEENVLDATKGITSEWLSFLDEAYRHFLPQLTNAGALQGMSLSEPETNRYFGSDVILVAWVYPCCGLGKIKSTHPAATPWNFRAEIRQYDQIIRPIVAVEFDSNDELRHEP
jgi:hypothetical protein